MKTILVDMSDEEFRQFADNSERISFNSLKKKVLSNALQKSVDDAVSSAQKHGLSTMTLAEIDAEVRAVRKQHG